VDVLISEDICMPLFGLISELPIAMFSNLMCLPACSGEYTPVVTEGTHILLNNVLQFGESV